MILDKQFVLNTIMGNRNNVRPTFEQAAKYVRSQLAAMSPQAVAIVDELVEAHQKKAQKFVANTKGKFVEGAKPGESVGWYAGPDANKGYWHYLLESMKNGPLASAAQKIDDESTMVVSRIANPGVMRSDVRGLVLGNVQSGKTANYTAVMAKAADEGYRLFIVLAGMHNNLRRQTQLRLERDLFHPSGNQPWFMLTDSENDFGKPANGAALLQASLPLAAVVKKNSTRLQNLVDFLGRIPEPIRERVPAIIIDDESDQATPNTKADKEEMSKINDLVRQIWNLLPTGTYLAYTATPFANVFMDPNDDSELYPRDFIYPLSRPDNYFGADTVFGVAPQFHDENNRGGKTLEIVREVPQAEADLLIAPSKKSQEKSGETYVPEMVPSLQDAVAWFVTATAVRYARGQRDQHSSMLVHNTHYTEPHFLQQAVLQEHVDILKKAAAAGRTETFERAFRKEADVQADRFANKRVKWEEVQATIPQVLQRLRVIVDNGESDDRLYYGDDEPEAVIVVGGGTLSRGLTLEGLVVSHFVRSASAYDTLLQMGRWFGYRSGYEDLVRIWTSSGLKEDYEFLAGVENEIRELLETMAENGETPRDVGIAVRSHPGRLEITAKSKMFFAEQVTVALGGSRMQTYKFDESDVRTLEGNIEAARKLVRSTTKASCARTVDPMNGSVLLEGVPQEMIMSFLGEYAVHFEHKSLQPALTVPWIQKFGKDAQWNVVLRSGRAKDSTDKKFDFGDGIWVRLVNRAPLQNSLSEASANIKALMSGDDLLVDQRILARASQTPDPLKSVSSTKEMMQARMAAGNKPLLVLYPLDKNSQPQQFDRTTEQRRFMDASEHVMAMGIVFPQVGREDVTYFAADPNWKPDEIDEESTIPSDREGDFQPMDVVSAGKPA